jgi:hypothetical protein
LGLIAGWARLGSVFLASALTGFCAAAVAVRLLVAGSPGPQWRDRRSRCACPNSRRTPCPRRHGAGASQASVVFRTREADRRTGCSRSPLDGLPDTPPRDEAGARKMLAVRFRTSISRGVSPAPSSLEGTANGETRIASAFSPVRAKCRPGTSASNAVSRSASARSSISIAMTTGSGGPSLVNDRASPRLSTRPRSARRHEAKKAWRSDLRCRARAP